MTSDPGLRPGASPSGASIDLTGKVALVTGSSRNIGRAMVLHLGRCGAAVVVNARSSTAEAQATVAEVEALGVQAMAVLADVGDEQQVQDMVQQVMARWGRIDILVNNAGLRRSCAFTDMATADWREVLAVNLDGPFFCCRAVVPAMIAGGGGSIINVSGLNAFAGRDRWAHVCAAKTGAMGLTRALAVELAPHHITVNHIVPGAIDTGRSHSADPLASDQRLRGVPLGRLGLPEEIAALCAFLASEGARFITGQTLHANGGALRC
jgi:3-oxoacyl-[acyl-carrier protein] reductase